MERAEHIQKEIEATLTSLDGIQVHELQHSLESRILNQLNSPTMPAIGEWRSTAKIVALNAVAAVFVLGFVLFYQQQNEQTTTDSYLEQFSSNSLSYETN